MLERETHTKDGQTDWLPVSSQEDNIAKSFVFKDIDDIIPPLLQLVRT